MYSLSSLILTRASHSLLTYETNKVIAWLIQNWFGLNIFRTVIHPKIKLTTSKTEITDTLVSVTVTNLAASWNSTLMYTKWVHIYQPISSTSAIWITNTVILTLQTPKAVTVLHQIIQSWNTGRWWVGCYIWYSEDGPGRAVAVPSPLFAVSNVTAHPSMASVPITVLLYDGPLLCGINVAIEGLKIPADVHRIISFSQWLNISIL